MFYFAIWLTKKKKVSLNNSDFYNRWAHDHTFQTSRLAHSSRVLLAPRLERDIVRVEPRLGTVSLDSVIGVHWNLPVRIILICGRSKIENIESPIRDWSLRTTISNSGGLKMRNDTLELG